MPREYDIARTSGLCSACGREMQPLEEFVAALFDADNDLRRDDFCQTCWQGRQGGRSERSAQPFSIWHSRIPTPSQPKRRFVDNEALVGFFENLHGQDEPSKLDFRFVLALMLMRKKLLIYDCQECDPAGREVWTMHLKGDDKPLKVVRPPLDEKRIAEVTARIGAVFEEQA